MGERIYRFIAAFIKEHGYSPSFREIGEGVGVKSTSHISYWVNRLAEQGRITYQPNIARSVRVVE